MQLGAGHLGETHQAWEEIGHSLSSDHKMICAHKKWDISQQTRCALTCMPVCRGARTVELERPQVVSGRHENVRWVDSVTVVHRIA